MNTVEGIQELLRDADVAEALTAASMALQMALVRGPNRPELREALRLVNRTRAATSP